MTGAPGEKSFVESVREELDRHAALVGSVANEWNHLQETLGNIFVVLATPDRQSVGWAAWQSLISDAAARSMLAETAAEVLGETDQRYIALKGALGQIKEMGQKRNDAVHSPFAIILEDHQLKITPVHFSGNQRAKALAGQIAKGRDLKMELEYYARRIRSFREFAAHLLNHIVGTAPPGPLPKIPDERRTHGDS